MLLLIDLQRDFCLPEGALFVAGRSGRGAIDDSDRIARFVYRNLDSIEQIVVTLDSHVPLQIFFPAFWITGSGEAVEAHREVSAVEIRRGDLVPRPEAALWFADGDVEWLGRQVGFYCSELERRGKYRLYLWPPHCLVGGEGHALVGVIEEARLFHSFACGAEALVVPKGDHVLTENYSAVQPEVLELYDGGLLAEPDEDLIDLLLDAEALIVAGQAASHCVRSTVDDLLRWALVRDVRFAHRLYILEDCMSSVVAPGGAPDFTPQFDEARERWQRAGVHIVRSTEPMASWPGMMG